MNEESEFRHNIIRAIQATLRRCRSDPSPTISEQIRAEALHVLEEYALNLPNAWPYTRELLLALAPKLAQAGYRNNWLATLHKGLQISQKQTDWDGIAWLHFYLGQLCRFSSRHQEAAEHLLRSRQLFAEQKNANQEAESLNELAYVRIRENLYADAVHLADQAMALVNEQTPQCAMSLSVLGLVAEHQARYQDAEHHHKAALEIRTQLNLAKERAWSLQNLGLALREQGRIQESTEFLQEALSLLEIVDDITHKAVVQMNLGANYDILGDSKRALSILDDAEQMLNMVLDDYNRAKLLTTKGLCYLSLSNYESAENAFTMSAELFQKFDLLGWELNALDGLAITFLRREWYERALVLLELIEAQLPAIQGTPAYRYLNKTLPRQIQQAKSETVDSRASRFQYNEESTN